MNRSVLLSGLYDHANGHYGESQEFQHFSYHEFVQPLPAVLRTEGYETAVMGAPAVHPRERFCWDYEDCLPRGGRWFVYSENGPIRTNDCLSLLVGERRGLLVRGGGVRRGVCRAMVSWADLAATVLEYSGSNRLEYRLHGRSLLPLFIGAAGKSWRSVFYSRTFTRIANFSPARGVRTQRFSYLQRLFPETSEELFDLDVDPGQKSNLADSSSYRAALARLRAETHAFRRRTQDPWLPDLPQ